MNESVVIAELKRIVEAAKAGVMATVDSSGMPHLRWLSPAFLAAHSGSIFAVTSPRSAKIDDLDVNNGVEWLFQTASLDSIVRVRGHVEVIDNPSLKSEVLEILAPRLRTFWKLNPDGHGAVVLETRISDANWFLPAKGRSVRIVFRGADTHGKE